MTTTLEKKKKERRARGAASGAAAAVLDVVPRVDLLPPMIEQRRRRTATLRLLMLGLLGLVLIAVTASFAVSVSADEAERELAAAQTRSAQLAAEQGRYTEVAGIKAQLVDTSVARLAALYIEADWQRMMQELDAALPPDVLLTSEVISIVPVAPAAPGAVTLDAPGLIEIRFTADSGALDQSVPLLGALQNLTGFVSATVDSVVGEELRVISGVVRLDARAFGTPRAGDLDPDTVASLRAALEAALSGAPAETPVESADGETATDDASGTED